jgi:hypothetical protein
MDPLKHIRLNDTCEQAKAKRNERRGCRDSPDYDFICFGLRSSGSGLYSVPRLRTKFGERTFYSGPAAWNSLLSEVTVKTICVPLKNFYRLIFFVSHSTFPDCSPV